MVLINKIPSQLVTGTAALSFVVLWIGFDNMGTGYNSHIRNLYKCSNGPTDRTENNLENCDEIKEAMENDNLEKKIQKNFEHSKKKKETNTDEVINKQPLVYSEENYKYNLFDELGSLGDNLLAHKMKQISNKNREAIDNFSRTYTKYANINYFEQELNDAAASHGWWDDDAHLSTKF